MYGGFAYLDQNGVVIALNSCSELSASESSAEGSKTSTNTSTSTPFHSAPMHFDLAQPFSAAVATKLEAANMFKPTVSGAEHAAGAVGLCWLAPNVQSNENDDDDDDDDDDPYGQGDGDGDGDEPSTIANLHGAFVFKFAEAVTIIHSSAEDSSSSSTDSRVERASSSTSGGSGDACSGGGGGGGSVSDNNTSKYWMYQLRDETQTDPRVVLMVLAVLKREFGTYVGLIQQCLETDPDLTVDVLPAQWRENIYELDQSGLQTALTVAVSKGLTAVVVFLLKAAGDEEGQAKFANWQNSLGQTAMMASALHGDGRGVAVLLHAGANPSIQNVNGETAIMMAAKVGALKVVQLLAGAGAEVSAENEDEETALGIATEGGWTDCVAFLTQMSREVQRRWWRLRAHIMRDVEKLATVTQHAKVVDTVVDYLSHVELEAKSKKNMTHVVGELLETERTYVAELRALYGGYRDELKGVMSPGDEAALFADNIPELIVMQSDLLDSLDATAARMNEDDFEISEYAKVLDSFMLGAADDYSKYCGYLRPAKDRLKMLLKQATFAKAHATAKDIHSLKGKQKVSLEHLLVHPMQRIARYPMYIERLLKCSIRQSDVDAFKKAETTARDVVLQVNLEMEQYGRMHELENILAKSYSGRAINSYGKVLREDYVSYSVCEEDDDDVFTPAKEAAVFVFEEAVLITKMDARKGGKKKSKSGTWLASIDLVHRGWTLAGVPAAVGSKVFDVSADAAVRPYSNDTSWSVNVRTASEHTTHLFAAADKDTKVAFANLIEGANWWNIPADQVKVGNLLVRGAFSAAFEGTLAGKSVCVKQWNAKRSAGGLKRGSLGGRSISVRRSTSTSRLNANSNSFRKSGSGGESIRSAAAGKDPNPKLSAAAKEEKRADKAAAATVFAAEAEIMKMQEVHPNLLRLYGVCMQPKEAPLWLITELEANGSLLSFLLGTTGKGSGINLPDHVVIELLAQAAAGVEALHSMGIVHRGLRSANMLVGEVKKDGTYPLKIGSFRRAVELSESFTVEIPVPLGFTFRRLTDNRTRQSCGFMVTKLSVGGNAEATGKLQPGMVIIGAADTDTRGSMSKAEFTNICKAATATLKLELVASRNNTAQPGQAGHGTFIGGHDDVEASIDSIRWDAPEVHNPPKTYSFGSDVFALAMTVAEVILIIEHMRGCENVAEAATRKRTRPAPYHNVAIADLPGYIVNGGRVKRPVDVLSFEIEETWEYIEQKCWHADSTDRDSAADLKNALVEIAMEARDRVKPKRRMSLFGGGSRKGGGSSLGRSGSTRSTSTPDNATLAYKIAFGVDGKPKPNGSTGSCAYTSKNGACTRLVASNAVFNCNSHACLFYECKEPKRSADAYCALHNVSHGGTCAYRSENGDCAQIAATAGGFYCKFHTCQRDGCNKVKPRSRDFCERHDVKAKEAQDKEDRQQNRFKVRLMKPLGMSFLSKLGVDGLVVSKIKEGGNAARTGQIHVGQVVVAINGYRLHNGEKEKGSALVRSAREPVEVVFGPISDAPAVSKLKRSSTGSMASNKSRSSPRNSPRNSPRSSRRGTSTSQPMPTAMFTVSLQKPLKMSMGRSDEGSLTVTKVNPGGSAESCGKIEAGMIITTINDILLLPSCTTGEAARMIKGSPGAVCSVSFAPALSAATMATADSIGDAKVQAAMDAMAAAAHAAAAEKATAAAAAAAAGGTGVEAGVNALTGKAAAAAKDANDARVRAEASAATAASLESAESTEALYKGMWSSFSLDENSLAAAAAIATALKSSGLPQNVLSKVWKAGKAIAENCGVSTKMNEAEFVECCKFAVRSGGVFPITSEA